MKTPEPSIISISSHGDKFTAEIAWDASVDDMFNAFRGLMICAGYHPGSIENYTIELAEELDRYNKESEDQDDPKFLNFQ
jgi:hypothetical protein